MSLSLNHVKQINEVFIKSYGPKTPLWRYYIRSILNSIGVRQPVEYYSKRKRLDFEYHTLLLWESYHLNVPSVVYKDSSTLHLSVIQGKLFSELFKQSIDLNKLSILFDDLNYRHQLALECNEARLCHIDANLENLIYSKGQVFHVDFEMGREYEPIEFWARRELSKLLISILQDRSEQERESVLQVFYQTYKMREVVNSLILSKLGRSTKAKYQSCNDQYALYNLALDLKKIFNFH